MPLVVSVLRTYVASTKLLFGKSKKPESGRALLAQGRAPSPTRTKLFANYSSRSSTPSSSSSLQKYLDMQDIDEGTLQFWDCSQNSLDKLYLPVLRALNVPASSATVERVFSQGGIVIRPHRARMTDKLLLHLIFLKCNESKFCS